MKSEASVVRVVHRRIIPSQIRCKFLVHNIYIFKGVRLSVSRPTPSWKTRLSNFVWVITLDLPGMLGPTSSYSTARLDLGIRAENNAANTVNLKFWFYMNTHTRDLNSKNFDANLGNKHDICLSYPQIIIYIQTVHRTTELPIVKSSGRATSLRVIPCHWPYNWGKSTENLSG